MQIMTKQSQLYYDFAFKKNHQVQYDKFILLINNNNNSK